MSISKESYDGWQDFSRRHRVTVSALADAVGLMLGAEAGLPEPLLSEVVALSGDITAERRSRRPPS